MKVIKGLIRNIDVDNRIFEIKTKDKIESFYLSHSLMNRFKLYIQSNYYCELEYNEQALIKDGLKLYEVIAFIRIQGFESDERVTFYDIFALREGISDVINRERNLMFIDLEFSMPPYGYHGTYDSDIVQYGYILVDQKFKIIDQKVQLLKTINNEPISDRTLDFLKKDIVDFEEAVESIDFYNSLKEVLEKYNPMIIVWGTNDILMIKKYYQKNNLAPLTTRASFINLMQLMKNYFGLRHDIGLFNALSFFDTNFNLSQEHDALQDAYITYKVYQEFSKYSLKQLKEQK